MTPLAPRCRSSTTMTVTVAMRRTWTRTRMILQASWAARRRWGERQSPRPTQALVGRARVVRVAGRARQPPAVARMKVRTRTRRWVTCRLRGSASRPPSSSSRNAGRTRNRACGLQTATLGWQISASRMRSWTPPSRTTRRASRSPRRTSPQTTGSSATSTTSLGWHIRSRQTQRRHVCTLKRRQLCFVRARIVCRRRGRQPRK
mmetsp:Transcript_2238/g.6330  ORF Transcript_2238/g.6330 Transcript_2238/m.6330 type:complete len:204 (+) Transcript_2238:297-908(+)